jgi:type I restriction enzyme, S subunit
MKKYDSYKDSGIEWIGEIPSHWDSVRLCYLGNFSSSGIDKKINPDEELVKIINFTDIYNNPKGVLDSSIDYMIVSTTPNKKAEHSVVKGDLIFLPSSETYEDLGKSAIVNEEMENVSFSYHVIRLNFTTELAHGFKKYLTNNYQVLNQFSSNGQGTTRKIIGRNVFRNIKIVIPPIEEQTTIANYLDQKTTQIDDLIAKKERLIQLLEEERTAIINQAVTKGLDPNVPMKDSGIEWLGEIPEHWEVYRIDWVSNIVRGNTGFKKDELLDNGDYVALQYGKTYKVDIVDDSFNFFVNSEFYKENQVVSKGDTILISTSETVEDLGHTCYYDNERIGLIGGEQILLKPNRQILYEKYLYQYAKQFSLVLKKYARGLKVFRFSTHDLKQIFIGIPSVQEQIEIAHFLDRETIRIDTLCRNMKQEIDLLKEYKTALISEVVTGKVDVRNEKLS